MTKKVLFITRKWPPAVGGMETYARRLSEELTQHCALKTLVLPGRKDGRPPSPFALLRFGVRSAIAVLRTARRYDVIHGADMAIWPLVFLARLRNAKTRCILSAHGTDVAYASRKGVRAFFYRQYLHLGARMASRAKILANSRATSTLLETHGYRHPIVIPLAADPNASDKPTSTPEPYVLYVGRLIERKGCGWFIKNVLPQLPEHLTLKIAGTIVDETERAAIQNKRVTFMGPVFGEELAALRRDAVAVIVPNIEQPNSISFEGFGLAAVEGAADGGVVVAGRVDGIEDAVRHGETGFLLPAGDASAWAEQITTIAGWTSAQRNQFLVKARTTLLEHYSWRRVSADTLKAYGANAHRTPVISTPPLISVVMPVYNAEHYLRAAINSILSQTLGDFEFIIIDDCSTDSTPAIIADAEAQDSRIKVFRNDDNQGVPISTNRGLDAACGKYIARLDADDIAFPDRFSLQTRFLDSHPHYTLIGAGYQEIDAGGNVTKTDSAGAEWVECAWGAHFRMPVLHSSLMFRQAIIHEKNIAFDAIYNGAADYDFTQRLLRHGKGAILPGIHVQYRMHPMNVSTRHALRQRKAAMSASIREAMLLSPSLTTDQITNLFEFVHGHKLLTPKDIDAAIIGLKALENAFSDKHKLNAHDQKRLKELAARWLSAAALRRQLHASPHLLSTFLWSAKEYLPHTAGEALCFYRRRLTS